MKNDQRRNFLKKAALGISGVAGISLLSQAGKAGEVSISKGKIIALNTSHRAGKTSFASLKVVLDSVQKILPEVESEIIELANLDFGFPVFDGTQPKDDLDEVIEKITAPDCLAIMIASPVYFALPTARCVAFIDRLSHMRRNWKLKNKILGLVTVANGQNSGQETVLHCLHNSLVTLQMIPAVDCPPTAHWGATLWNRNDSIEADRNGIETDLTGIFQGPSRRRLAVVRCDNSSPVHGCQGVPVRKSDSIVDRPSFTDGHSTVGYWSQCFGCRIFRFGGNELFSFIRMAVYPMIQWGDPGVTIIFVIEMFAMIRWKNQIRWIARLTLLVAAFYIIL